VVLLQRLHVGETNLGRATGHVKRQLAWIMLLTWISNVVVHTLAFCFGESHWFVIVLLGWIFLDLTWTGNHHQEPAGFPLKGARKRVTEKK